MTLSIHDNRLVAGELERRWNERFERGATAPGTNSDALGVVSSR